MRQAKNSRFRVDAYLAFDAPRDAHPERWVDPVKLRFLGDADVQRLEVVELTLNGKRPEQRLVAIEPSGTAVLGAIDKALRTEPWALHLAVTLAPERGRLAMPRHEIGDGERPDAPMTVTYPDGREETFAGGVDHIVVGPTPEWRLWGGAVAGVAAVVVVALWRRRRRVAAGRR